MDDVTCTTCQRPIRSPYLYRETFPNPDARFCWQHAPQRHRRRLVFRCQQCGIEEEQPTRSTYRTRPADHPDRRRRYCSVECRTEAARQRRRGKAPPVSTEPRAPLRALIPVCVTCGVRHVGTYRPNLPNSHPRPAHWASTLSGPPR